MYDNGLSYYERELERAYIAQENGYDTWEEYYEAMQDDIANRQIDEYLGK